MAREIRLKTDIFKEVGFILQNFGENNDRGMARRRLNLLKVNFKEMTRRQQALVNEIKRRL